VSERFYREPGEPVVALSDVLDLLEKRAQIEAPNAAAALRWTAKLAVQKWGGPAPTAKDGSVASDG
jgi:hypothetical protein